MAPAPRPRPRRSRLNTASPVALSTAFALALACSPAGPTVVATPRPGSAEPAAPACPKDRADCDSDPTNGCEAALTSRVTCGACDVACGAMESCVDGRCLREHRLHAGAGACAIRQGRVQCWGPVPSASDEFEATPPYSLPRFLEGIQGAITVRFNASYSFPVCAVLASGELRCSPGTPPVHAARSDLRDAAGYGNDVCVVTASGHVFCGNERVRGVSDATAVVASDDEFFVLRKSGAVAHLHSPDVQEPFVATPIPGVSDAADIASAYHSLCILSRTGTVTCSEMDFSHGTPPDPPDRPLVPVPGLTDAVAIDVGCAVRANGEAVSWASPGAPPAPIPGVQSARSIACGSGFGCYERDDGAVLCWGSRRSGRLGDGAQITSYSPLPVTAVPDAKAIYASYAGTCALRSDGAVWCWGTRAVTSRRGIPAERVPGVEGAISLSGAGGLACAASGDKGVRCFPPGLPIKSVTVHEGLGDVIKAVTRDSLGVALRRSGEVVLFDARGAGPLSPGDGARSVETPPPGGDLARSPQEKKPPATVVLPGVRDATDVVIGYHLVCALRKTGAVACADIRPGVDALLRRPPKVLDLPKIRDVVQISEGYQILALRKTGAVVALSLVPPTRPGASPTLTSGPSPLDGAGKLRRVFAEGLTSCGVWEDGRAFCLTQTGALLRGTGVREPPTMDALPLKDLAGVAQITIGFDHACALLETGKLSCWGENNGDALGGGAPPLSLTPVEVPFQSP